MGRGRRGGGPGSPHHSSGRGCARYPALQGATTSSKIVSLCIELKYKYKANMTFLCYSRSLNSFEEVGSKGTDALQCNPENQGIGD